MLCRSTGRATHWVESFLRVATCREQNSAGRRRLNRLVTQPGYGPALRSTGGVRKRAWAPDEDREFAAELQAALQTPPKQQRRRKDGRDAPGWQPAHGRGRAGFLAEARGAPQLERSSCGQVKLAPHSD